MAGPRRKEDADAIFIELLGGCLEWFKLGGCLKPSLAQSYGGCLYAAAVPHRALSAREAPL
jgi:hypothetical protein